MEDPMRISIEHVNRPYTKPGKRFWNAPTSHTSYDVHLTIQFTQEELALIKKHDLWQLPLIKSDIDFADALGGVYSEATATVKGILADCEWFSLKDVMEKQPFVQWFGTPGEANQYEQNLRNKILPTLKNAIDNASAPRPTGRQSFEL